MQSSVSNSHGLGGEIDRNEVDFFAIFAALWRRKWLLIFCAFIGILIGGYNAYFVAIPKYSAQTALALQVNNANVVDIDSVVSGVSSDDTAINTELEIIRSRGLIEKLMLELKLYEDPEFNAALRPEPNFSIRDSLLGVREQISALIATATGSAEPEAPAAEAPQTQTTDQTPSYNGVITNVRRAVTTASQRNTYIFFVRAKTQNPKKSALIANTLAQLYLQEQTNVKFQATENAVIWLSDRVAELKTELELKEDTVKSMRSAMDLGSAEELEALNQKARDIRQRSENATLELAELTQRRDRLQSLKDASDRETLAAELVDPLLNRLLRTASESETDARLFDTRVDSLLTQNGVTLARAQQRADLLSKSLTEQETNIAMLSNQLIGLQQAERDIEATRTLYETFLVRLKETSVQRGLQQADARILSEAASGNYVEPRKSRILILSAFIGMFIGAVIAMIRQFVHFGFRSAAELEMTTGLITLGQLPRMPIRRRKALIPYLQKNPTSATAEAVRNLRTSVMFSNIDNPPQVIMVSSSVPGEGKTTQTISLAHNFAGLNKRILLVECDLRRRTFGEYFPVPAAGRGLLAAMEPDANLAEIVYTPEGLGFDVLLGETSKTNAADVFASRRFQALIERLRTEYDYIIIDVPPVLVVPDARMIGHFADAILFAVSWNNTNRSLVRDALAQFATAKLQITGTVLNQVDMKGQRRYGYNTYSEVYYDT